MGKAFRDLTGLDGEKTTTDEMRKMCSRPGRTDDEGNIVYTTEQQWKDECNVNNIIQKYDKNQLITHVNEMEAHHGDMTGADYKMMMDKIINIRNKFDQLPSSIRKRFQNSPEAYLAFMEDPKNRPEAIKLGLVKQTWAEQLDGIGEHITAEQQKERDEKKLPETE
jgi:phage internal scaffolding protein